jgi:hypothetical protein
MVKPPKALKSSSTSGDYRFFSVLAYDAPSVRTAAARGVQIVGEVDLDNRVDQDRWKDPPHIALANLRLEQDSIQGFIKMYGLLHSYHASYEDPRHWLKPELLIGQDLSFCESVDDFAHAQDLLRRSWTQDWLATVEIEGELEDGFEIESLVVAWRTVALKTCDLWKAICFLFLFLFLLDYFNGVLRKCHNPDCPAPFFIARRQTQKFCELGPCTEYAQRQYALKWWREKGAKRRAKRKTVKGRKKKR